jgi:glycosyltransferase involved in cell wall biosynthesis
MTIDLVVPGPLDQATGGYRYAQRLVERWRASGQAVVVHELPGRFPDPDDVARDAAAALLARLGDAARIVPTRIVPTRIVPTRIVIDGLALPAFYDRLTSDHVTGARVMALIHHPLGLETGLARAAARRWLDAEAAALRQVRGIIVTSPDTAGDIRRMGVEETPIVVVLPGTDRPARLPARRDPRMLLTVASLTSRKGHVAALAALAALKHLRWRLLLVGSPARDPACARHVRRAARDYGLGRRVRFAGELSGARLAHAYAHAGLFLLASRYEGYGMAFAEAMAWRLPVVGLRAGAVGRTVPRSAGILARPGDRRGLTRALRTMLALATRRRYAAGAARAGRRLPRWEDAARAFAYALDEFTAADKFA